jgi:hypothetical protein
LAFALLAVVGLACSSSRTGGGNGKTVSSTTAATTKVAARPVPETVVVELSADLGPFVPRARGMLRPKPSPQPRSDLLEPLGSIAEARAAAQPATLVTIGDVVKFDGAFPGEKGKWDKWDKGVEELIHRTQAEGTPVIYEVWKEPNRPPFKDRVDFFAAWVHTVRQVRRIAPGAVLMGPGISKNDGGWVGEFLKYSKEWGVLPDVVGWHEDGLKHDISGHVGGVAESFWQDGTNLTRIIVSANASIDDKAQAGDPAIFLAQVEKAARDNAWRRIMLEFGFKLSHLFTNDLKRRSVYYTYEAYATLDKSGRTVRVNGSDTVDGVAVWSAASRTCRLVLGRDRSRVDAKRVLGDVTLQVKGAVGATVHVAARRIVNTGQKASEGPEPAVWADFPLKNKEARVPLPRFGTGDAYVVEVTVRGKPPSTATATTRTTRPATSVSRPTSARSAISGGSNDAGPSK